MTLVCWSIIIAVVVLLLGTAIDDQDQSNTTEPAAIDVAAVVGDVIVLNIPDDMTDVVEVRIEELQREGSKPPTKAPIIFRADVRLGRLGGPRVQITIPPESTAQLEKDSSYFVKVSVCGHVRDMNPIQLPTPT